MMYKIIENHFNNFIQLIRYIKVTTNEGNTADVYNTIEEVCRLIKSCAKRRGRIMFIGNGGSAAIASHMAIDFWKNGGIKSMAFNDSPLLTCISNDYGYQHVFEKPIEMFAETGDILFAISSSGKSENILKGVQAAQLKGCSVITLSGFDEDNPLRSMGICNFYVPSHEYGLVEVIHQYICHCILDVIIQFKNS